MNLVGKTCRQIGCPQICYDQTGYCQGHKSLATVPFSKQDRSKLKLYNTSAWKKLRLSVLKSQPICARCKRAPANVVHHIIEARKKPELQLDRNNLEALCSTCHNRESQKEGMKSRRFSYA